MRKLSLTVFLVIFALVGAAENQGDKATPGATHDKGADEKGLGTPVVTTIIQNHHMHADAAEHHDEKEHEEVQNTKEDVYESSEESKGLKARINDDTGRHGGQWQISAHCLDCLCSFATECDLKRGCQARSCGPFGISYVFWEDAFDYKTPDGPSYEGKRNSVEGDHWEVTHKCLDCLCDFATDCSLRRGCETPDPDITGLDDGMRKGDCGPFHISFPFWADGNNVVMDLSDAVMEEKWKTCSLDLECATESIQKYFKKYPHDCNKDGKVDCLDYAAIHTLGPFGCLDPKKLSVWNSNRRKELLQCLVSPKEGAYAEEMRKIHLQDIAKRAKQASPHAEEVKQGSLHQEEVKQGSLHQDEVKQGSPHQEEPKPAVGTKAEGAAQHVVQH